MNLVDKIILNNDEKLKGEFRTNTYSQEEKERIVAYLKNGNGYVSVSSLWECEFCNEKLSMLYYIDGKWMWGKWLIHYVEEHNVGLPTAFLSDMEKKNYTCPQLSDDEIEKLIKNE